MKKITLFAFSLFLCVILSSTVSAQPTLTGANMNPQAGESFILNSVQYQNEGASGTNVTWDFSNLTPGATIAYNYVQASSTPHASSFPNADIAYEYNGSYDYYATTSSAYSRVGAVTSGILVPYSDAQDHLRFPFTYNSTYTDDFSTTFTNQGVTYNRTGTITVEADGYGTLILPDGTVNDVLRVKATEGYTDRYTIQGILDEIDYISIVYRWFKTGIHHPVLAFTYFESSISAPVESGTYLNPTTVGVPETLNEQFRLSVLPNPAVSQAAISFNLNKSEPVQVTVLNSVGQVMAVMVSDALQPGRHNYNLDVESFPAGIYFVKMKSGGAILNHKFFIRH